MFNCLFSPLEIPHFKDENDGQKLNDEWKNSKSNTQTLVQNAGLQSNQIIFLGLLEEVEMMNIMNHSIHNIVDKVKIPTQSIFIHAP